MSSFIVALLRAVFGARFYGADKLRGDDSAPVVIAACGCSPWSGALVAAALHGVGREVIFPAPSETPSALALRILNKLGKHYPPGDEQTPPPLRALIKQTRESKNAALVVFPDPQATPDAIPKSCGEGVDTVIQNIPGAKLATAAVVPLRGGVCKSTIVNFGEVVEYHPPRANDAKVARKRAAHYVLRMMEDCACQARVNAEANIALMLANSGKLHGFGKTLFAQLPSATLTYRTLCRAAFALGGKLPRDESRIGVMLPSTLAAAALFYACQLRRIAPVMLNPGAGEKQVLSACRTAKLKVVYTAALLLEKSPPAAKLADAMRAGGVKVVLLEELRETITVVDKLKAAAFSLMPAFAIKMQPGAKAKAEDAACVLFTSGSESEPKGVVLTHGNLIANCRQVLARLSFNPQDKILNTLPVFHSFGLLAGFVLPPAAGVEAAHYPTPLHYSVIPKIMYSRAITIFFSADTFLANYAKNAEAEDFQSLRLVVAGAEKLKEATRMLWRDKFNICIFEGYGVTETAPVISFNRPGFAKAGTVGIPVPLLQTRIVESEGIERGGVLHARGPNIMAGYLLPNRPGEVQPPPDGWHNTGDIAGIDGDGFLSILGRKKRFVKIAGEMAPLDGIEECLSAKFADAGFAVVGIASETRGETAALLTTLPPEDATRENITSALREGSLPELWAPRIIKCADEIPLLPTGKTDYPAVQKMFGDK